MEEFLLNDWNTKLGLEKTIHPDEIPKLDLYMDQLIQLFENKFKDTLRNDKEKVLTKTMVNNYGKDKLFFPIEKKKYTREHVLLIAMIYHLKGGLSIPDIKLALSEANEKIVRGQIDFQKFYSTYIEVDEEQFEMFQKEVERKIENVRQKSAAFNDDFYIEQLLMIAAFVQMSTMYRKMAEMIVDKL